MAKNNNIAQPMTEKDWQAQMDAEAIAHAEVVRNDPVRMTAAKKMAEKMARDKMNMMEQMKVEHQALSKFAGNGKPKTKPEPKAKTTKKK